MEFVGAILSNMGTFIVFGMIVAVGYKVFQMGSDLREVKELLEKIYRRADEGRFPIGPSSIPSTFNSQSPEDLIRAMHAAGIPEAETDPHPHPLVNSSEV